MAGISAILTAAGESTRMGRPKPLLPWRGTTLIEHQVASLVEAGAGQVIVVLGHEAESVAPYIAGPGVEHFVNPHYREGKATSIKAGLRRVPPDAGGILLLAVDQPRTARAISALIQAHLRSDALITCPRFRGQGGHPRVFSSRLRDELERISEESEGIRAVFQAHRDEVNSVETDDPMVLLDLNTPEAYEAAKRRYGM